MKYGRVGVWEARSEVGFGGPGVWRGAPCGCARRLGRTVFLVALRCRRSRDLEQLRVAIESFVILKQIGRIPDSSNLGLCGYFSVPESSGCPATGPRRSPTAERARQQLGSVENRGGGLETGGGDLPGRDVAGNSFPAPFCAILAPWDDKFHWSLQMQGQSPTVSARNPGDRCSALI